VSAVEPAIGKTAVVRRAQAILPSGHPAEGVPVHPALLLHGEGRAEQVGQHAGSAVGISVGQGTGIGEDVGVGVDWRVATCIPLAGHRLFSLRIAIMVY